MKTIVLICSSLLLVACSKINWEKQREKDFPVLNSEWEIPVALDISDLGWCESIHCSPDGDTLYYFFYPGDDLWKDARKQKFAGEADAYYSVRNADGTFTTHQVLTSPEIANEELTAVSGLMIDEDGYFWCNSNHEALTTGEWDIENIYRENELLPFNKPELNFGNPHYNKTKDELWFDGIADKEIWVLKNAQADGFTGTPVVAPSPINQDGEDAQNMQAWLSKDGMTMYFSSNRGQIERNEWRGGTSIYRTTRNADDTWAEPTEIASSKIAIGDATLTEDMQTLFFVQYTKKMRQTRTVIYMARRK